MCDFLPFDIKIKYNYLQIEGRYMATLTVLKYTSSISFLKTMDDYYNIPEIKITFNVTRQNTAEVLKKLTRIISNVGAEMFDKLGNKLEENVLIDMKKEAEKIKKDIQIDGQQIYLISTYISTYANSEQELMTKVRSLVNKLYVHGIVAKPNNFKQKEGYLAMLPIGVKPNIITKYTENICTEAALSNLFPYFTRSVLNTNGTIVGRANGNICSIDLLNEKNMNYNMCVFGTSGAGKSYYIKLYILRSLYKNINQIIIDPEGEYEEMVKKLGGNIYEKDTYNPFEISENFAKRNSNFLQIKIDEIVNYLNNRFSIDLDHGSIKEKIRKMYLECGITCKLNSLYTLQENDKIYLNPKYKNKFPDIKELLTQLNLKANFNENSYSTPNNKLHLFVIKSRTSDDIKKEITLFIPKIYELIEENTLIYFDEIWKCISMGNDKTMLEEVYNMFKTLRKKKAGIVAISQDIGDLFNIDGGNFGKSILNNSHTKMFFRMEYSDMEKINKLNLELKENNVSYLDKGSAYVKQGNTNYKVEIRSNKYEHCIIERKKYYEESIGGNG